MGQIQNLQTDYLRDGTEQISYKTFSADGTYIDTADEDVLINCPTEVVPLNKDLTRQYDRPLKEVNFITDLRGDYIKNENAHFIYGSHRYVLGGTSPAGKISGTGTAQDFIEDTDKVAKALSGGRYFRTDIACQGANRINPMLSNDREHTKIEVRQDLKVDFDYYIKTTSTNDKWEVPIRAFLQETYSETGGTNYYYDFESDEWKTSDSDYQNQNVTSSVNAWNKSSTTIKGYTPTSDSVTEVFLTITIGYPNLKSGTAGGFSEAFFDNFRISETYPTEKTIVSKRKQYSFNGTYTGVYDNEGNVLTNVGKNLEYFLGKIEGNFKRPRDTVNKSIEQIVTQEVINDHRQFLRRYEGTFRAVTNDKFLAPHKKVWIDFGDDLLQEPVTCYVDAVTYDVKAAEYDLRIHLPNQDDDIGTTFNVIQQ